MQLIIIMCFFDARDAMFQHDRASTESTGERRERRPQPSKPTILASKRSIAVVKLSRVPNRRVWRFVYRKNYYWSPNWKMKMKMSADFFRRWILIPISISDNFLWMDFQLFLQHIFLFSIVFPTLFFRNFSSSSIDRRNEKTLVKTHKKNTWNFRHVVWEVINFYQIASR